MRISTKPNAAENIWLEQGYIEFALEGPENLSINKIGRETHASRSSFYHYFAEIEIFVDELLARHWEVSLEFNKTGKETCKNLIPDLYNLLEQYSIPLQFSRQLFRNRHIPKYNYVFVKTYEASAEAFILDLFADHMGLHLSQRDLHHLFLTLGEAWYSRLDPHDLSAASLQHHAESIMKDLSHLISSDVYTTLRKAL